MRAALSIRLLRVWQRNWTVYRRTWKISFAPPLLEPLFYLLAFGIGLGKLLGEINYRGELLSYSAFIAPALIAANIMNSAFFENTYASFVRMYYQKTFNGMLATPLTLPEIIVAEILWGATKAVIGTVLMMGVISLFGFISFPSGLLLVPLAFIGGLAFGALGMACTAVVPSIEAFNLAVFLFITPMFLFSGTFFPLDTLPEWAQALAQGLPLTHLVHVARALALGRFDTTAWWGVAYLTGVCLLFVPLAIAGMRRRLIK
jgi:lipooligosaccharide transport system permease protein